MYKDICRYGYIYIKIYVVIDIYITIYIYIKIDVAVPTIYIKYNFMCLRQYIFRECMQLKRSGVSLE